MKNMSRQVHSDRFIPMRSQSVPSSLNVITNKSVAIQTNSTLCSSNSNNMSSVNNNDLIKSHVGDAFTLSESRHRKQLTFSRRIIPSSQHNLIPESYSVLGCIPKQLSNINNKKKGYKNRSQQYSIYSGYKIIDIPNIVNDFYSSPIDMCFSSNYISLSLSNQLFLYRQYDQSIIQFNKKHDNCIISCVKFIKNEPLLLSSSINGYVQVHDINKISSLRHFRNHYFRVSSIEIDQNNKCLFYSGSKDYQIHLNDLRQNKPGINKLIAHKSQVTGLKMKNYYLASGSNDGNVKIWDTRVNKVIVQYNNHKGAVKAIQWCPWKSNMLLTGGGKKDNKIIFYNTDEQKIQHSIITNNQITSILLRQSNQQVLYSTTSFDKGVIKNSNYFNKNVQKKKLNGIYGRIISSKIDKNNDNIIMTVSSDQCLRFFDIDKNINKLQANQLINQSLKIE